MFKKMFVFLAVVLTIAMVALPTITARAWASPTVTPHCAPDSTNFSFNMNLPSGENNYIMQWSWSASFSNLTSITLHAGDNIVPIPRGTHVNNDMWYIRFRDDTNAKGSAQANGTLCHVECALENQVAQAKVYGATTDVPPAFGFGPWTDDGNGKFSRSGTMNTTTPWTQEYKDNITGKVCRTVQGSDPGTRPYTETKDATYEYVPFKDCTGWSVTRNDLIDGNIVKTEPNFQTGTWSNPFVIETADTLAGTITESAECQRIHHVIWDTSANCEGWNATYKIDGPTPVVYDSGIWSNIYVLETANPKAFTIPENPGEVYDFPNSPSVTINEPRECLVVLAHNAVIDVNNGCPGWTSSFSSSDGGIGTPTTPTFGLWVDPYKLEGADVTYHVTWPDGYSANITKHIDEPETCLIHKVAGVTFTKAGCGPNGSTYAFVFPPEGVKKVELTKGTKVITLTGSGSVLLSGGTWSGKVFPQEGYDIVPPGNAFFTVKSTVCPDCTWNPTGRKVFVNYMFNTDPMHYGFWGAEDGSKTGVCTISTFDGNPPTLADQIRLCGCGMPTDFIWHTDDQIGLNEVKNSCTGEIRLSNGWELVDILGGYKPNQPFCTAEQCPPRP